MTKDQALEKWQYRGGPSTRDDWRELRKDFGMKPDPFLEFGAALDELGKALVKEFKIMELAGKLDQFARWVSGKWKQ